MKNNYIICNLDNNQIQDIKLIEDELKINILPKNSILEDLENEYFSYFVLKDKTNKNIVGYIATSHVYDTMDIISIVIKKDYQRLGLASYLLNYIINFAKEKNISNILLEVRKSNIPAQRLYKKFNFKKINERKNYYKAPIEDALIYKLEINNINFNSNRKWSKINSLPILYNIVNTNFT